MANLAYIDLEKSIETGRLVSKPDWFDMVDKFVFSMLMVSLIGYPLLIYFTHEIKNANEKALGYVLFPIIILFGLYSLYRKLTDTTLLTVETGFDKQKNKEHLLDFITQKGYEIFRQSKDIIIVNSEESLSYNNIWTKTITFIISDRKIYFNIVKKYPRLNPPVLFTHLSLKADLKKFLKVKCG